MCHEISNVLLAQARPHDDDDNLIVLSMSGHMSCSSMGGGGAYHILTAEIGDFIHMVAKIYGTSNHGTGQPGQ